MPTPDTSGRNNRPEFQAFLDRTMSNGPGEQPTVLEAALAYASKGWLVLPLKGKKPLTRHGVKDATSDPSRIRAWWQKWPHANVGIATGAASGIIVLDIDRRNGGFESLAQLERKFESPLLTAKIKTADGLHLYFKHPGGHIPCRSNFLPGIDVKANGGYVVAVPSIHPDGPLYEVLYDPGCLADPPPCILALTRPVKSNKAQAHTVLDDTSLPSGTLDEINVSDRIKRLIRDGDVDGSYPSRSEAEFAALCALVAARCDDETINAIFFNPAHRLGDRPRKKGVAWFRDEIMRARDKATDTRRPLATAEWPAPLAPEAFYGLAGDVVEIIEPHSEADPAALLIQLLVMVGSAAGRNACYQVGGDFHRSNLFVLLVGETSKARKGTSYGIIKRLLSLAEEHWTKNCVASGLSSGEGLIWSVRDRVSKKDPGVTDKRLLVVEAEFASTLKVMGRDGNILSGIIRQAWDQGNLRTLTKKSPARATNAHISIIGHVTKIDLKRYLNATEAGNGFANRFLFVSSKRSKYLPLGGGLTDTELQPLADCLHAAIEYAQTLKQPIALNEDALTLWCEVYPGLSDGKPGLFGSVTSRAEAQVIRLALIYAVLDRSEAITSDHLKAALAVWLYCEDSARYIFGEALGDPIADTILGALRASPQGLTRTEISDLFKRHQDKNAIATALASLQEHGRAHYTIEPTGGRPTEKWFTTHDR